MQEKQTITRRDLLRILGSGTAAGVAGAAVPWPLVLQGQRASQTPASGAIIRTVQADIAPASLADGAILFHEHLSARWGRPTHFSDDVALIAEEVKASRTDGVACIVDAGHPDIGRSMSALQQIATASGMPIVASGGFYTQRLYPSDISSKTVDTLADEMVRAAAAERHGALGEIGQEGEMTADEQRVFQAVGKAHVRTRLPIFTHNAYMGTRPARVKPDAALGQLDLLESAGVKPQSVALGHMCCLHEPGAAIAQQVAKRGAFVGFDRVLLEGFVPDADKVTMILKLLEAGFEDQLLLSSDFFQESALKKRGGPGIAQTVTVFGPKLLAAGVPHATLRRILVDNPKRFLAFVPI
jgi:phosphotriesterase-related protein